MSTDDVQADGASPQASAKAADAEEAKREAMKKLKPVGPIMKAPTPEEIQDFLHDPEVKERDALADAMPKGAAVDDYDEF